LVILEKEWKGSVMILKRWLKVASRPMYSIWKGLVATKRTISDNMNKYEESKHPLHFAISLSGEPTLYPKLPELITELKKNNISSLLLVMALILKWLRSY
jgi:wyosine [tRNA(Phe)-imidazoG37] synthetase (radical SAM superfamily)